jgi:hypothetical protein
MNQLIKQTIPYSKGLE